MQTPIDFGKDFLNRLFDQRDADACLGMLAGDLVWITPEEMHHFLSEGAVLRFLRRQIAAETESMYVDLISIKSSPSADNIMTVAYEVNLVSREDETPSHLRCSMAICRRGKRLEITFLHFSKKSQRDGTEQLRDFVTNLPCGVMILACLDGQREEAIFYNEYFAHRLRYRQEEFARLIRQNPFFMVPEEDRERIREQIAQARQSGGNIGANLRFFRRDGNSFYYRMMGAPAYQENGGTVYYCVFQETTGYMLTANRLQSRLDTASEILRLVPEGICGIEYPPENPVSFAQETAPAKETAPAADISGSTEEKTRTVRMDRRGIAGAVRTEGNQQSGTVRLDDKPEPGTVRTEGKLQSGTVRLDGRTTAGTAYAEEKSKAGTARTEEKSQAGMARRAEKGPRVFFTSKNITALFGVSNSVYMNHILQDPFYGLEITSITREKLLGLKVFRPGKSGTTGPVSCGIFRIRQADSRGLVSGNMQADSQVPGSADAEFIRTEAVIAETGEAGAVKADSVHKEPVKAEALNEAAGQNAAKGAATESVVRPEKAMNPMKEGGGPGVTAIPSSGAERAAKPEKPLRQRKLSQSRDGIRVELVARRVQDKDGTSRLYLFYFDRESQQQEMEERVDRAMKMGRAGQEQLRTDLQKAKENAARRQKELNAALKEAQQKHEAAIEKAENQLAEEKNRSVLMSRQLEESRAAQKSMAEELEKTQEDASRWIRNYQAAADRKVREAQQQARAAEKQAAARAEGKVREIREQARAVEEHAEARMKEKIREAEQQAGAADVRTREAAAARDLLEEQLREAQERSRLLEEELQKEKARRLLLEEQLKNGGRSLPELLQQEKNREKSSGGRARSAGTPRRDDWMTQEDALTVFSSMDPRQDAAEEPFISVGREAPDRRTAAFSGQGTPDRRTAALSGQETPGRRTVTFSSLEDAESASVSADREARDRAYYRTLLRERTFSPESYIRNILLSRDAECREKGIELRFYLDSRLPASVTGYEELLKRALYELLESSIERTQRGGTISVHCRANRPSGGLVNLSFRIDDDGTGMTDPRKQMLPGTGRAADQDKEAEAAVPPGLYAAREAATLMGGSIHTRSIVGGNRMSLTVALHI